MAASDFKVRTFDKSTNTSTPVDQTITSVGTDPVAMVFWGTRATAEGGHDDHMDFYIGFSDGTNHRCCSAVDEDNLGVSDNYRDSDSGSVIVIMDRTDGSILAEGTVAFGTDQFTITWNTNNAEAIKINYLAVGGSNITDAEVGTFNQTATNTTQSITTGITPAFFIMISTRGGTEDAAASGAFISIGMASGASEQGAIMFGAEDNQGNTLCRRSQLHDRVVTFISSGGTNLGECEFTGFDGADIDLSWTSVDGTTRDIYYLAIEGGAWEVGNDNSRTSTGNQAYTTTVEPTGLFMFGVASPGGADPNAANLDGFVGACDGTNEASAAAWSTNGNADTNSSHYTTSSHCLTNIGSVSVTDQAAFSSFNATDFTLNFGTADASARPFVWAVMEADAGAAGLSIPVGMHHYTKNILSGR